MNQSPIQVSLLQKRIRELESEIERLRHLLKLHGITEHDNLEIQENICSPQITAEHARLLYSYFKGRKENNTLKTEKYTLEVENLELEIVSPFKENSTHIT